MRLRALLYTSSGQPRLLLPCLLAIAVAFALTLAAGSLSGRPRTDREQAEALLRSGKPAQAEAIYARLVRQEPSVPLLLSLLDAHDKALVLAKLAEVASATKQGGMGLPNAEPPMPDDALDALVAALPREVSVIGRFWRGVSTRDVPPEVRDEIEEGAKRNPPVPWANHVLAREAMRDGRQSDAAPLYEREGLAFPARADDVNTALEIWMGLEAWDYLLQRMQDPRVAAAAEPMTKYRIAVYERDWKGAALALPRAWRPRLSGNGLAMSAVAAIAWGFFCTRLGKLGSRARFRLPLYLTAFALGVASIIPTVLLIAIEEAKLRLVETGDVARDILFFVFGVGLREEASKLLLFAPLLPILRRWGDKLDVLVCGALVGLGFAAEENLGYLADQDLSVGLGRFLTANFFHMAMTGIAASALDDFVADRERNAAAFTRATLLVVVLHGAYDFLIVHHELGGAYLAMTVFVILAKTFLDAVDAARRRADRGLTPLHAFILAVGIVTGVSLAHAYSAVGAKYALLVLGSGLLGEGIIVYVFVRTLRTM